ncbi:MAG TPA: hypothetical protein VHO69_12455 [Phototrophicaceae bacterium]|nr:hypothetical protein [Phototrophicaceae bacterium]
MSGTRKEVTDFRQDYPDGIILALDQMSAYLQATLPLVTGFGSTGRIIL